MAGGVLLTVFYTVLVVRQALEFQARPTLGTPIHLPLMRLVSSALVLLIVGLLGLLIARVHALGGTAMLGGVLLMGGFALWAYAAAENFVPLPLPPWAHPLLFPALVALGSLEFGTAVFRSRRLPRGAAALLGVFGAIGMALLAIAEHPVLRLAGFFAMLLYGVGWVWLGYRLRRLVTAY